MMPSWVFYPLATLLLASGLILLCLRQPVHCALAAGAVFALLGALFVALDAEFVGLVQILVYVGAVAILIVFVILLTKAGPTEGPRWSPAGLTGIVVATALFFIMGAAIIESPSLALSTATEPPQEMIAQIGVSLLSDHLIPLQSLAVLLTAALIGATLFVWDES